MRVPNLSVGVLRTTLATPVETGISPSLIRGTFGVGSRIFSAKGGRCVRWTRECAVTHQECDGPNGQCHDVYECKDVCVEREPVGSGFSLQ